jgi:hypothetical protein
VIGERRRRSEGDVSDWMMRVIKAEAKRLIELAADDEELRADLRGLAEEILAATADNRTQPDSGPSQSLAPQPSTASLPPESAASSQARYPADATDRPQAGEPLRELTFGRSVSAQGMSPTVSEAPAPSRAADDDLARLEARCRRKAETARWAAERVRRQREGNSLPVENGPADQESIKWAGQLTDSFYWMKLPEGIQQADLSALDNVGGCFEALADALALVAIMQKEQPRNQKTWERTLPFVTEAQSALRAAFQRLGAGDDPDQLEVFEWLKLAAARHHVYIKRFMRADDLAAPSAWADLMGRIESATAGGQLSRQYGAALERMRNELARLRGGEGNADDWLTIIDAVDAMIGAGVPPSNRELRDLLLPVIDEIPERDDLPAGFRLVLREIDRFLALRSHLAPSPAVHAPSSELSEAARLLRGRSVLLIGGNRRREAQEALRRSLGLAELVWLETKEHEAIAAFEPLVARLDIALVLLAIRWSSHAFGDVKLYCERHGKPLVRLPGGYNPNQVAAQILGQCSGQLS